MRSSINRPEEALQRAAVEYLHLVCRHRFLWFHVPSGGARTKAESGIFKALGVRPGVPDLVLIGPDGFARLIELKSDKGRLSPAQREFLDHCQALGVPHAVARSLEEVADEVHRGLAAWGVST